MKRVYTHTHTHTHTHWCQGTISALTLALLSGVFSLQEIFLYNNNIFDNTPLRLHDFVQYTLQIMYMHFIPIIFRFYVSYFEKKTDWGSQVTPLSMIRNFIIFKIFIKNRK